MWSGGQDENISPFILQCFATRNLFVSPAKLHLTVCMLTLLDANERAAAVQVLTWTIVERIRYAPSTETTFV